MGSAGGGSHAISGDELTRRLDACIGKTLRQLDSAGALGDDAKNKGRAGAVFEQSVFGYPADSYQRPDFEVDGTDVELKVTGLVEARRDASGYGYRAKEPMSITAVSPDAIVNETFSTSAFWHKAERLLVIYYLYVIPGKGVGLAEYGEFEVKGWELHEWSQDDRARLEKDWRIVQSYVRVAVWGNARDELMPGLSSVVNRLLLYLDTAPKWPHAPRFRLKNSVVTQMAREHFGERLEQLPHHVEAELTTMDEVDAYLHGIAELHAGKTLGELARLFGMDVGADRQSKQLAEQVACRLLGSPAKKMSRIDLFAKASLLFKSVVMTERGGRTEDMKLLPIDFDELLAPDAVFEDSEFSMTFSQSQLMCFVLKEPQAGGLLSDNVLLGFKRIWLGDLLEEVHGVWNEMRRLVFAGELRDVPVLDRSGVQRWSPKTGLPMSAPNWPKSSGGNVFVRGSSSDASNKPVEVAGVRMYRQSLWLRGTWVCSRLYEAHWV